MAQEVPRFVQFVSPVANSSPNTEHTGPPLPLNLIARICSYLDDAGDLARVTRTSRLLYYMCSPQLYEKVSLHSYAEMRYIAGRPEGFGSGSPFMMGLNGLVTGTQAQVVQELRLWGEWREVGVEEFAQGRVPDNSMMLNILLRASVDRMVKLRAFAWELDCKPLRTLYTGLSSRTSLTKLTLRFPSSRVSRPTVLVPPMPALKEFRATDIDPLCYPDDISLLLLGSKNLQDVRMHFSPRMRAEAEPTLSFETYWGRCFAANYKPKLLHFGMQNWYGANNINMTDLLDSDTLTSLCFINNFGGVSGGSRNIYVDDTWKLIPRPQNHRLRTMRINEIAEQHIRMLRDTYGLQKLYFMNDRTASANTSNTSTPSTLPTPDLSPSAPSADLITSLGHLYIDALVTSHGSTLTHLLLSDMWAVSEDELTAIVRHCPNLSQFGLALGFLNTTVLRILLPFLTNLTAFRILSNAWHRYSETQISEEEKVIDIGRDVARQGVNKLRWIGLGDMCYEVRGWVADDGAVGGFRKDIVRVEMSRVMGVEIWELEKGGVMLG